MTVQQMLGIACRYSTAMADAMVCACLQWSVDTGQALDLCPRAYSVCRGDRPTDDPDWERLVSENTDSRWNHC